MYSCISQELKHQPPDSLSSGGKEKSKRTGWKTFKSVLMAFLSRCQLFLLLSSRWNDATWEIGTSKLDLNEMPPSCSRCFIAGFHGHPRCNAFLLSSSRWRSKRSVAQFVEVSCQSRQVEIYAKLIRGWSFYYYSRHYLLYSEPVNNGTLRRREMHSPSLVWIMSQICHKSFLHMCFHIM